MHANLTLLARLSRVLPMALWTILQVWPIRSYSQPKIIITKYKCSTNKKDIDLYKLMKGAPNLDSAFRRIVSSFIEVNHDFFQLRCTAGCTPPLIMEFPLKRYNPSSNAADGLNTSFNQSPRLHVWIEGWESNPKAEYASDEFSDLLQNTISGWSQCLLLSAAFPKESTTMQLSLQDVLKDPNIIDSSAQYTIVGENINYKAPQFTASSNARGAYFDCDISIIDNAKRQILTTRRFSTKLDRSYNHLREQLPRNSADSVIFQAMLQRQADSVAVFLKQCILLPERDSLVKLSILLDRPAAPKDSLYTALLAIQPVLQVYAKTSREWLVIAACSIDCLAMLIQDSPLGKNYLTILSGNGRIILKHLPSE